MPKHRRFHARTTGDHEHHALAITRESCLTTAGPTTGSVNDSTVMMEWDGWRAKELSGFGVGRKPGATIEFQDLDGQVEVTLADGKPTGWTATGHSIVTLATGDWAPLKGKTISWTGKGAGPNVSETVYTWK